MDEDYLEELLNESFEESSIYTNRSNLQAKETLKKVICRDKEIKEITRSTLHFFQHDQSLNLLIKGDNGIGKKRVLNESLSKIEKITKINIKRIFIDCKLNQNTKTEYIILLEILKNINCEVPSTGLSANELYNILDSKLKIEKDKIILIFSNIDILINNIGIGLLENIQISYPSKIGIIGITNRKYISYFSNEIKLQNYNLNQLVQLLKLIVKENFRENVIDENEMLKIAEFIEKYNKSNVNILLKTLLKIGDYLERNNLQQIEKLDKLLEKM